MTLVQGPGFLNLGATAHDLQNLNLGCSVRICPGAFVERSTGWKEVDEAEDTCSSILQA